MKVPGKKPWMAYGYEQQSKNKIWVFLQREEERKKKPKKKEKKGYPRG